MSFWEGMNQPKTTITSPKVGGFWDSMSKTEPSAPAGTPKVKTEENLTSRIKSTLSKGVKKGLETTVGQVATSLLLPGSTPEALKEAGGGDEWTGIKETIKGIPQAAWDIFTDAVRSPRKFFLTGDAVVLGTARGLSDSITNIFTNLFVKDETERAATAQGVKNILDKYLPEVDTGTKTGKQVQEGFKVAGEAAPYIAAASVGGELLAPAGEVIGGEIGTALGGGAATEAGMAAGTTGMLVGRAAGALAGETGAFVGLGQAGLPKDATAEQRANQVTRDLVGLGLFKIGSYAFGKVKTSMTDILSKRETPTEVVKPETVAPIKTEVEVPIEGKTVDKGFDYLKQNLPKMIDDYVAEYGNVVNPDNAKKLFREVGYNGTNAAEYHEASSKLSGEIYDYLLKTKKGVGNGDVVFTAGGSGVGKTTAIENTLSTTELKDASIVYDANMSNFNSAVRKIDMALSEGYKPKVLYVYRNPVEAYTEGVLKRLTGEKPRYVKIDNHIQLHEGSADTVKRLAEKYGDKLEVRVINNGGTLDQIQEVGLDFLNNISYNKEALRPQLYEETNKAIEEGRVSPQQIAEPELSYQASIDRQTGEVVYRRAETGDTERVPLPEGEKIRAGAADTLYAAILPDPGLDKFIAEDIKPGIAKVKEAVAFSRSIVDTIKNALINIIEPAKPVEIKFGKNAYGDVIRAIHTPEAEMVSFNTESSAVFDSNYKEVEKFFNKFSDYDLNNFNLTRGTPETDAGKTFQEDALKELNPQLKDPKLIETIKEASDYVWNYAQKNGIDVGYMEDYFYGSYKNPDKVARFLDYWKSTEKYAEEKVFPTIADAEAFGLELRNTNPFTNIKEELKAVSYRVALKGLRTKVEAVGKDFAVMEKDAIDVQQLNWKRIEDPVFKDMLFDPQYANFVNSLISTNKIMTNPFLRGLRETSFIGQQTKFFGSLFHMKQMAKVSVSAETAGVFNPKGYVEFAKAFKKLNEADPIYKDYINLGGGRKYSLEVQAETQMNEALAKLGRGNYLGGLLKLPKVVLESKYVPASPGFIKWMFNDFIPTLKFNKFNEDVVAKSESLGRDLTDTEKIDIIKRNQNFYGEMNERLFGRSATVTTALRLIFNAPGYGEGNFRTLFSAGMDKTSAKFVFNSLVTSLTIATVGTLWATGQFPKVPKNANDVRDLFKIKTNLKDAKGDAVYFDQMTYDKDYWSIIGNLATLQFGKIPEALAQRIAGMTSTPAKILTDLSMLAEGNMVYNYNGEPLWYSSDTFIEKVNKLMAREFEVAQPISLSNFSQAQKTGGSFLSSVAGSVTGERPVTSEAVKEAKQRQQDLYSLQDAKKYKQSELNKLAATNPKEAVKEAQKFNKKQQDKFFSILNKYGIKSTTQSDLNKYVISNLNLYPVVGTQIKF